MINKDPGIGRKFLKIYKILFSQKTGVLLLIMFSLSSSIKFLIKSSDLRGVVISEDIMSGEDDGFKELNEMVRGEKSVGYIFEESRSDSLADFPTRIGRYYSTQYSMCPVIVDIRKRDGYVVGIFPVRHGQAGLPYRYGAGNNNTDGQNLVLVRDFGKGVLLFKRQGRSQ